jgi:hypothetical protein
MRCVRLLVVGLISLVLGVAAARAEAPPDPLRLVPDTTDLMVEVKKPRQLAETVRALEIIQKVEAFGPVREILESTNYRRFHQLVAYFEKQLGAKWPELLDRLAGGGAVVAAKIQPDNAPVLLVVQGTDAALMKRFAELGLQILEQEVARNDGKDRLEHSKHREVETWQLGKDFHAALAGTALLLSNKTEALHAAIDLSLDGPKKSLAQSAKIAEARKLAPADPLAMLWFNMDVAHKNPQVKDVFAKGRDPVLTVLFGGWLDTARRASFLTAALAREGDGFLLTLRMPSGREGAGGEQSVHVPPTNGAEVLPPLEPPGVILSHSFFLDVGKFWDDRAKIFTPEQVKNLEDTDTKSALVLAGQKLSTLLKDAGARHRFVAANPRSSPYKRQPKQPAPAFAVVAELRDPVEFTKTMNTVLRGVALIAGSQFKLKLADAKHGDYKLIAYKFDEEAKLNQDPTDIRFNFTPCFTTVGNYFIASSTTELCHDLIDLLEKESKQKPIAGSSVAMRTVGYAPGTADSLAVGADALLAQTILSRAVTFDEARAETKALIDLVRQLGQVKLETEYHATDFRVNLRWQPPGISRR